MKTLFTILLILPLTAMLSQENCGSLEFQFQSQVDQFLIENPNCTVVDNLSIVLTDDPEGISDLSPLSNLTEVTGYLAIYNYGGADQYEIDTSPLSNITTANEVTLLNVGDNSGFIGMTDIPGSLLIEYNFIGSSTSHDLNGFDNLQSVGLLHLNIVHPNNSYIDVFPSLIHCEMLTLGEPMNFIFDFNYMNVTALTGFNALESLDWFNIGLWNFGQGITIETFDICPLITNLVDFRVDYLFTNNWQSFENLQSVDQFAALMFAPIDAPIIFPNLTTVNFMAVWVSGFSSVNYVFPALVQTQDIFLFGDFGEQFYPVAFNAPALTTVPGTLDLRALNEDVQLNFSALDSVFGTFSIHETALSNLDAFAGLEFIGAELGIYNNPQLSECAIDVVCQALIEQPELVYIDANGEGCQTVEEVMAQCAGMSISGVVYSDLNCNGQYDANEVPIAFPIISDVNNVPIVFSSSSGFYALQASSNTTYSLQVSGHVGYLASDVRQINTGADIQSITNQNIGLCPDPNAHDLAISIVSTPLNPGFAEQISIIITNASVNNAVADVHLTLPSPSVFAVLGSNMSFTNDGTALVWSDININGFESIQINLDIQMNVSVALGSVVQAAASVTLNDATDLDSTNDSDLLSALVTGSYDPNDITVNRVAIDYETVDPMGEWLTYRIRFQNTGTAPAQFVYVINEQSALLDLNTIQMISTSHSAQWSFDGPEVTWFFDNIQLPDSTSDPLGSQGEILFRIRTLPGISLEDIVESTAAIYFDYNEPVITNTAQTVFYVCPQSLHPQENLELCWGEAIQFNADSGWETYTWTIDGDVASNAAQLSISGLETDNYVFEIEGNTVYCAQHIAFDVVVLPAVDVPQITTLGNALTVDSGGQLVWYFNGELLIENVSSIENPIDGTYHVIRQLNGCSAISEPFEYVTFQCPDAVAMAQLDATYCTGTSIALHANGTYDTYTWLVNGEEWTTGMDAQLNLPSEGVYEIHLIATAPNCASEANAVVNALPAPSTPLITQDGDVLVASGNGVLEWSLNGQSSGTGSEIAISDLGTYVVTADLDGCSASSQWIIDVCQEGIGISGPNATCYMEMNEIFYSGPFSAYTTYWLDEVVATGDFVTLEYLTLGEHSYTIVAYGDGCLAQVSYDFTVFPVPAIPTLTQEGNTLMASGDGPFVWHLNGIPLTETSSALEITESGIYNVAQTNGNCIGLFTGGFYDFVGVDEAAKADFIIYPNPASVGATVLAPSASGYFNIFSAEGRLVKRGAINAMRQWIDLSDMAGGFYSVTLQSNEGEVLSKVQLVITP